MKFNTCNTIFQIKIQNYIKNLKWEAFKDFIPGSWIQVHKFVKHIWLFHSLSYKCFLYLPWSLGSPSLNVPLSTAET